MRTLVLSEAEFTLIREALQESCDELADDIECEFCGELEAKHEDTLKQRLLDLSMLLEKLNAPPDASNN